MCDGWHIEVVFYLEEQRIRSLMRLRSGRPEEAWEIARMLTEVLESIFYYEETPSIIRMAEQLVAGDWWLDERAIREDILIHVGLNNLTVRTAEVVIDEQSWSQAGLNAYFNVESHLQDWELLLSKVKAQYKVVRPKEIRLDELPGYRFLLRGEEGSDTVNRYQVITGEEDLGIFSHLSKAIISAVMHHGKYGFETSCAST